MWWLGAGGGSGGGGFFFIKVQEIVFPQRSCGHTNQRFEKQRKSTLDRRQSDQGGPVGMQGGGGGVAVVGRALKIDAPFWLCYR